MIGAAGAGVAGCCRAAAGISISSGSGSYGTASPAGAVAAAGVRQRPSAVAVAAVGFGSGSDGWGRWQLQRVPMAVGSSVGGCGIASCTGQLERGRLAAAEGGCRRQQHYWQLRTLAACVQVCHHSSTGWRRLGCRVVLHAVATAMAAASIRSSRVGRDGCRQQSRLQRKPNGGFLLSIIATHTVAGLCLLHVAMIVE